jgi:hypothetical protein
MIQPDLFPDYGSQLRDIGMERAASRGAPAKQLFLGNFKTGEEAHAAYCAAVRKYRNAAHEYPIYRSRIFR